MRVALACRYPHVEVLLSRTTTICELIDRLTQYWQLNNHAQSVSSIGKKILIHLSLLMFQKIIDRYCKNLGYNITVLMRLTHNEYDVENSILG